MTDIKYIFCTTVLFSRKYVSWQYVMLTQMTWSSYTNSKYDIFMSFVDAVWLDHELRQPDTNVSIYIIDVAMYIVYVYVHM